MTKDLQLTVEQARELYQNDNSLRTLLSVFSDEELGIEPPFIKSWEDLGAINGAYLTIQSNISLINSLHSTLPQNKNIAPSTEHAKSMLAFAQLSQLCGRINEKYYNSWTGWFYTIVLKNKLTVSQAADRQLLYFCCEEDAQLSLKYHRDLWEQYWML